MRRVGRESGAPYIATPSREHAVERLTKGVQAGEPVLGITGPSGSGKSVVVREALRRLRSPRRLTILIEAPADADDLAQRLRDGLGWRSGSGSLEDLLRLPRWEGRSCAIALDSCRGLAENAGGRLLLERLRRSAIGSGGAISLIASDPPFFAVESINLPMLTRAEASAFLRESGSRRGPFAHPEFSPSAVAWLHALTRGSPRWLDWLANQARGLAVGEERRSTIDEEWLENRIRRLWPFEAECLAGVEASPDLW